MAEETKTGLEKEALDRRRDAKSWKEKFVLDFKECYFFASPSRQRQISSDTQPPNTPMLDQAELQTSVAMIDAQDFVTEAVNTYMPESQPWCERGRGMFVPKDKFDKIKGQVAKDDGSIFEAMKASNLYTEIQKAFFPDLAIGTAAVWIRRMNTFSPIAVLAVPLRELEVNLGPDGEIDDRFVVRYTKNRYIETLLPGVTLPQKILDKIKDKPNDRTQVWWGFWRKWDRADDECWQMVAFVGDDKVDDKVLVGEGSCPLIVMRFNPSADWPWGLGPLYQALPDLRQVDELEGQKVVHIEMLLHPADRLPGRQFRQCRTGAGKRHGLSDPRRRSHDAIKAIYDPGPADSGIYLTEEKEKRLRKMFFVDFPEQTGDTPPTLGQWLDEMARAQRRIGGPGASFYREGPAKIFLRFKYLLEAAGIIQPIKVDGRNVSLLPYNPAQRAAEQQEIATNVQAIQICSQAFPEEFKVQIDGAATMKALLDKMRAKLVTFRDKEQIKTALAQITPLIKGHLGDTGQGAGAPASQPQLGP
jgi:hypothetical protein